MVHFPVILAGSGRAGRVRHLLAVIPNREERGSQVEVQFPQHCQEMLGFGPALRDSCPSADEQNWSLFPALQLAILSIKKKIFFKARKKIRKNPPDFLRK